jgi:L-lactate dehydrogenase complex protein LldF
VTEVSVPFYRRVEDALGKTRMRQAVRHTSGRAMESRRAAIAELDSSDAVRDQARAIRARTLAELDRHLDTFVTNVEANGGTVFFAETGDDAVDYVRRLARDRGIRTIVKGKSMVSEEIELNPVLEGDGIAVVETDLGEYIVQLDDDKPSHIVAPILHKTKEDCARVFKEKLGATDEEVAGVPQMTQLARRVLRKAFLEAEMGITGVNFGVAETGSVTICTNEGNGRLSSSLPRVYVAIMGLERLVPTAADLGVMLEVLGRSGTGQRLTVYSNILSGPRRSGPDGGEPDGPEEFHVVIVDNGRSAVLASELAEILYCIRCGACLYACPVYQQIGGHAYGSVYSGPIGSVLSPALAGIHGFPDLPHASTLCGACKEVCPVRIDIPRMLLRLRAKGVEAGESPQWVSLGIKVLGWIGTKPALFGLAGRVAARLAGAAATDGWIRELPLHLAGWTASRDFPAPAKESFQERWAKRHGSTASDGGRS